jgi:hypothetical protein
MTDIITLRPRKVTYSALINVHHWSGECTNSVRVETESPLGPFAIGDRLWIGGLDGFPESRLTMGRVRAVKHFLGGNTLNLTHDITVDVDEDREGDVQ